MQVVTQQTKHFIGNEAAKVTIIEFSDYQWPYCGRFAAGAGRQIFEKYVQTGEVRFGYIHFTFLGQESIDAAQASECAGDQDAFWEYHDLLFEKQNGENQGAFNEDNLLSLAKQAGLDTVAFQTCIESQKYESLVSDQTSFSQSIGVRSTPSFLVNGVPVIGAQGYEVFEQIIEDQLKQ